MVCDQVICNALLQSGFSLDANCARSSGAALACCTAVRLCSAS